MVKNPLTGEKYSGNDIKCIVNTSAKIQCGDDGRNMPELILSLSSNFYDEYNEDKDPSDKDPPKKSCNWLKNFIETRKIEKSKETFFFPWLANGHFGLLCIDMSKDKPITYFDSGDMFISDGVGEIRTDSDGRKDNFKLTFGNLIDYFDKEGTGIGEYFPGPVNFYYMTNPNGIGQKSEETDCNYWVEALQGACYRKKKCNSQIFRDLCCDSKFLKRLEIEKNKIKSRTQNKVSEYKLNKNKNLYPSRYGLGGKGLSVLIKNKNSTIFPKVQYKDDQSIEITLEKSKENQKLFKDIELIKITPKKLEDKQLLDSNLIKQIEKNGFTKEILEKNNITIKRSGVNHFEPMGQFLSKNINEAITGFDNRKQSREI